MVRLPPNKSADRIVALAEQLTLARAALEDTPHAAPPLVRLQSVSEIPVGFEFVRGHGRQGAVPTTPPRRRRCVAGKNSNPRSEKNTSEPHSHLYTACR